MIFLRETSWSGGKGAFPFTHHLFAEENKLDFSADVTFIVGENGTGKSTILESLALWTKLPIVGSQNTQKDPSLEPARLMSQTMRGIWNLRARRGFFLRAEDFFNFIHNVKNSMTEMQKDIEDYEEQYTGYGLQLAKGSMLGQQKQLESRYGENPHAFSHGESFLNLFQNRLAPKGLYILDEPEVPLSPLRQLALIAIIIEASKDSQFIIATHSPMLLAIPDAQIIHLTENPPELTNYDDLPHVKLYRNFLDAPQRYIRNLMTDF